MLLLLFHDSAQRFGRGPIDCLQDLNLLTHVAQHHPLDSNRGSRDSATTRQARHRAQNEPTKPTPKIGSAPPPVAAFKLRPEPCPMTTFVRQKAVQLLNHFGRAPAGEPALRPVYANRAMLTRMIDLHDPIAQRFSGL